MSYGSDARSDPSPVSPLTMSNGTEPTHSNTAAPKDSPDHLTRGSTATPTPVPPADTSATTSSSVATNTTTAGQPRSRPRPRPNSLRLHVPPALANTNPPPAPVSPKSANATAESNGHPHPGRRRPCPAGMESHYPHRHARRQHDPHHHHHYHPHQTEMSSSAPPSGHRSLYFGSSDRLANTMAATPVSHASSQHLLVNFEESMLNGRIHPVGQVDGFTLELGASGSFVPDHARIPMQAYFFDLSDDNTPSPYLGYADLSHLRHGKGYHVPKKGSVQLTLFNPNKFVVKMFVIGYDFEDMPPNSQTFLRQRTVYMPIDRSDLRGPHTTTTTSFGISHTGPAESEGSAGRNCRLAPPVQSAGLLDRRSAPDLFWSAHGSTGLTGTDSRDQKASATVTSNGTKRLSTTTEPVLPEATTFDCPSADLSFPDSSSVCSCSDSCSSLHSSPSNASCSSTCSLASANHVNEPDSLPSHRHSERASGPEQQLPAFLRYLVHLRFHTTRSGRLYLHTDLRLIFARDKFEFDPRVATYELRSFVDAPSNPRYSPKK